MDVFDKDSWIHSFGKAPDIELINSKANELPIQVLKTTKGMFGEDDNE